MYAGIKERNADIRDMLLTDICPFSLSVSQYNEADPNRDLCDVLIERNMALPVSRETIMTTAHDRQTKMRFKVYQGEAMYAEDNLLLGSITGVPGSCRTGRKREGAGALYLRISMEFWW